MTYNINLADQLIDQIISDHDYDLDLELSTITDNEVIENDK
jgi:hypothetical protein